jgi:ubiquinone biosynthesis protein UbiJ
MLSNPTGDTNMTSEERSMAELGGQVEELREELAHVSRQLTGLEARLDRLEVREEILEGPAAGDEPVGDFL